MLPAVLVYNSVYLPLAQDLDCPLVTSDKALCDRVLARSGKTTKVALLKHYSAEEQSNDDPDLN